ncbi:ATP-grasp domain-containing protein [Tateyamaria sp. syn59]|uniref:ATP-grasp domain-containing protein n=1 Tax=Tateyamaria sp. syn59 TaxID=2576942 RepID=UPI00167AF9F2|nr:ATP-grasp domain-containing protein [Tateyamaria sp. syn59]
MDVFAIDLSAGVRAEAARFKDWCKPKGLKPDSFCCMSEPDQEFWQAFANAVGVGGLPADVARALRDKPTMKARLNRAGFATAPFAHVKTLRDLHNFVHLHGFPIVLKPVNGWGTLSTTVLKSANDLESVSIAAGPFDMMVEAFIQDEEYELCALIAEGEVLHVFPSLMPSRPVDAAQGSLNANISVGKDHSHIPFADLREMVQRVVDAFELPHGYLHMEVFISSDGSRLTFGELALRYPGCEIARNHGLALGFDIAGATLDTYLGLRPTPVFTRQSCVGDLLLPYRTGYVRHITSEAALMAMEGVIGVHLPIKQGDVLQPLPASSFNCTGWVFIEGETPGEVAQRMRQVHEAFELAVEELAA